MAVSGSKDFAITRSDIIEGALRKLGIYDAGDSVSGGDETTTAAKALNLMVKALVTRGADLFLREEVTLFLQPQTQSYSLGTSGSAHATASFVETTLSAAEASGQTVISVTSSTGMTAADNVGIKMDDDSIHWTTIVSVDSSTQITITTATDAAASSGNKVYAYTTKADRPQKLLYAYRRDTSALDTEVSIIGETEYRRQSNKSSEGPPVEIWYHPTLTSGTLYVWPVDGGSTWDKLIFVSQYLPDDFDSASDNPEFPIEWGECLVYNLADRLAPEYGIPSRERRDLKTEAEFMLAEMLAYDVENADVQFVMGE
jgi:hypothetical protein